MTNTTIEALKNKQKLAESSLLDSSTAYARDTKPTTTDISTVKQLASINKQIESLRSEQIRNQWYGQDDVSVDDAGDQSGLFMKALKGLQRPLSGIMGAGQYALGKGTETSLVKNINEAMKKGLVAGDILEQYGAPRAVQIPLGFALDVMFDPINWATAGTAALIPRIGMGAIKGGLKGAGVKGALSAAATGATSSLEKKAAMGLGLVPFAKRIPAYKSLTEKMGTKAITGAEKYDTLMGKTVYDKLGKGVFGMPAGVIGRTIEKQISKIPSVSIMGKQIPSGEAITDFFKYSAIDASAVAVQEDLVKKLAQNQGVVLVRTKEAAHFLDITDVSASGVSMQKDLVKKITGKTIKDADEIVTLRYNAEDIARNVGKKDFVGKVGDLKPEFVGKVKVYNSLDNAKILLENAEQDYNLKHLIKAYKVTPVGKTGFQWYDNVIDRFKNTTIKDLRNVRLGPKILKDVKKDADKVVGIWNKMQNVKIDDLKPFEKFLDGFQNYLGIFKWAKVPANVSSHVVATIGNFFMGGMLGLPTYKLAYIKELISAHKLVRGKMGVDGFGEMFLGDLRPLLDLADSNPTVFKQATGISAYEISDRVLLETTIKNALSEVQKASPTKKQMQATLTGVIETLEAGQDVSKISLTKKATGDISTSKAGKKLIQEKIGKITTPSEQTMKMLEQAPVRRGEEFGSWAASELQNTYLDSLKRVLAKKALDKSQGPAIQAATKALNVLVNKMPRWYEHIDQSFKLGTVNYLTKIGLTEQELVIIGRTIKITKDDLLEPIIKGGEKLYRTTPLKAAEVATEAYMNYAAMPDFVRMMRAIPVVGAPFISFPFAMAAKTAKTAINNPAVFNKIGFMIDEMNVGRTPEEKMAMEEKYNKYLNEPTVVKMFGMWNTNVKNFVPYYTMNMFNPSERTYDDSIQGRILKMTDKIPMFQEPSGQILKDYFIQPWVLSGTGQIPQGQFGQPLYPAYDEEGRKTDVGFGTKAFYAGRTMTEAVVPGTAAYLGWPLGLTGISPEVVDYLPSYGMRNLANATQGRSTVGAMTKEDAVRKTLRSLLGRTGFPAYTLDTSKTLTR